MRKIVDVQPVFFMNLSDDNKLVAQYRRKYEAIDRLLDSEPSILNELHRDLKDFGSKSGRQSRFSTEQLLRVFIVRFIEQLSYRETVIRIAESDFLRNFTRIGMGKVMGHVFLCGAFKHISPMTWASINRILCKSAQQKGKISPSRLRVDSTTCETNIHYPTDSSLLWDAYRVISRTMGQCSEVNPLWHCGNRFHPKKIKKLYVYVSTHSGKKNKATVRKVKKAMQTLVERVWVLCDSAQHYVENAKDIGISDTIDKEMLDGLIHFQHLGTKVVQQAYDSQVLGNKVPASQRIFSIFEEHTELLKRGKARKPIEFGHMVTIGQTAEKFISFYDVQEKSLHDTLLKDIALKKHKKLFGQYPSEFTADKNYYAGMEDIESWEEHVDCMAIGKKGRRNQAEKEREHSEWFRDLQKFRAGVEGSISVLKRAFGLRRCLFKGFKGFALSVGCLVFCHNLVLLTRL